MNILATVDIKNKLLKKISSDLEYGVKVLGDEHIKSDVIRVWTTLENIEFAINANSLQRFSIGLSSVEIQSFEGEGKGALRLKVISRKGLDTTFPEVDIMFSKLSRTFYDHGDEVSEEEQKLFLEGYLQSKPSKELTQKFFKRNPYQKQKLEFVNPELYY